MFVFFYHISRTFDGHLDTQREVFQRFREAKLPKPGKMPVLHRSAQISQAHHRSCIRTDPEKVQTVTQWPASKTVTQSSPVFGPPGTGDSSRTSPPSPLRSWRLPTKTPDGTGKPEEAAAFERIKTTLTTAPIFCPDFTHRFYLQTDASTSEAVLTQNFPKGKRTHNRLHQPNVKHC